MPSVQFRIRYVVRDEVWAALPDEICNWFWFGTHDLDRLPTVLFVQLQNWLREEVRDALA